MAGVLTEFSDTPDYLRFSADLTESKNFKSIVTGSSRAIMIAVLLDMIMMKSSVSKPGGPENMMKDLEVTISNIMQASLSKAVHAGWQACEIDKLNQLNS
jgi:hypothetical protein